MNSNTIKFLAIALSAGLLSSWIYREAFSSNALQEPELAEITVAEDLSKDQLLMEMLMSSLQQLHYQPQEINDVFSEKVFSLYLQRIDYNKRFLHQKDVEHLGSYKTKLDDAINDLDYSFFSLSEEIILKRINEAQAIYEEILAEPFDFTMEEKINLDPEKLEFVSSDSELRERWRKALKYSTLDRLNSMIERKEKGEEDETQSSEESENLADMSFEEMEAKAREKVKKNMDNWFNRLRKLDHDDRVSTFLNCITNAHGPHTGYFPPIDKENFDIAMSGKLEGIGARLQEKDGYIKVSEIVPGSASYRQGELKAGDLILMVAQADGEPVDIVDMPLNDVVKLVRGKKGTEVRLTVKKKDGTMKVIPIIRDIVVIEATYAKSCVVENANAKKVGYIRLPGFYADFNNRNGRRCSTDVLKEIEKLKNENVSGIILDLRNNGGGSLRDAVDMAGYFIEDGPVVQVKARVADPSVLRDKDPGIEYDGPLVILVNRFSASASEILAAAMQDYNRGVVIGTSASFGKGTVQRFFGLDQAVPSDYSHLKPIGEVKITTQKFYRINGGATQLRGVEPDIVLPDPYSYVEGGEGEQDYVMEWDEIKAVKYDEWKPKWKLSSLKKASDKRVSSSATFKLVEENAQRLKNESEHDTYSLNLQAFQDEEARLEQESKAFESLNDEIDGVSVYAHPGDVEELAGDSIKTKVHEDWLKSVRSDLYINEAMNVISDMQ